LVHVPQRKERGRKKNGWVGRKERRKYRFGVKKIGDGNKSLEQAERSLTEKTGKKKLRQKTEKGGEREIQISSQRRHGASYAAPAAAASGKGEGGSKGAATE